MPWGVAGASRTGPAHRRLGHDNQDAWALELVRAGSTDAALVDDVVIIAVADGAGSLPRSGEGARLAVAVSSERTADELLCGSGLRDAVHVGLESAREALCAHRHAAEVGATLSLLAASSTGWACTQVGDSFAVLVGAHGELRLLRPEAAGEYANLTRLLTSAEPRAELSSGDDAIDAAFVSTDGLAQLTLAAGDPHPGFYLPLLARARRGELECEELLAFLDDTGRLEDDTTIATAWRTP